MSDILKPRQSPENDSNSEFELVLSLAWARLREAAEAVGPGYAHSRVDRHPGTNHQVRTFVLAETYEKMISGKGNPFTISMPIDPEGSDSFLPGQDPAYEYFVIGKPGDYDGQVTYGRQDYEAAMGSEEPTPVDDLILKLATYEVIPYLKYA